jgi:hypothetical protein
MTAVVSMASTRVFDDAKYIFAFGENKKAQASNLQPWLVSHR